MVVYDFMQERKVPIQRVFDYVFNKLGGFCTMWGSSAYNEHEKGDTFLAILGEIKDSTTLKRLYHVNPHAGRFVDVECRTSNHITITSIEGRVLEDKEIKEIRDALDKL